MIDTEKLTSEYTSIRNELIGTIRKLDGEQLVPGKDVAKWLLGSLEIADGLFRIATSAMDTLESQRRSLN